MLVLVGALLGGVASPVGAQDRETQLAYVADLQALGVVTEIGVSQTVDETTITLEWGYVDEHVVMVNFTVYNPTDGYNDPANDIFYVPQVEFTGSQGEQFQGMLNWGNLITLDKGQMAWEYLYGFRLDEVFMPGANKPVFDYFNSVYGGDLPETLGFNLEMTVNPVSTMGGDAPRFGFFEDAPFEFHIELPPARAVKVLPDVTQTVNDAALTLQSVAVTPGYTRLVVCADYATEGDWQPVGNLTLNGVSYAPQSYGIDGVTVQDEAKPCFFLGYQVISDMQPGTLTFTVDQLRLAWPGTPAYWDAVKAELAKHDVVIEVHFEQPFSYELISKPNTMTEQEYGNLLYTVREDLMPVVDGPWVFEVEMPGAELAAK